MTQASSNRTVELIYQLEPFSRLGWTRAELIHEPDRMVFRMLEVQYVINANRVDFSLQSSELEWNPTHLARVLKQLHMAHKTVNVGLATIGPAGRYLLDLNCKTKALSA